MRGELKNLRERVNVGIRVDVTGNHQHIAIRQSRCRRIPAAGVHVRHGSKAIDRWIKDHRVRISHVVRDVTAGNKHASISQCGMARAEKCVRGRCRGSKRIAHRVPYVWVQRLRVVRNKKYAAIRQQCGVNSSGGPVGNRRPLALGGSLGVTAYCYCNYKQKK
jgi:hypothetical protein